MEKRKTLVIGASENPQRYSYKAINSLVRHGHPVVAIGLREGEVAGVPIHKGMPVFDAIHTVTLYVNPTNQIPYQAYILDLKPERVIFNPGTENPEFMQQLAQAGIEVDPACTLVLLASNQYS